MRKMLISLTLLLGCGHSKEVTQLKADLEQIKAAQAKQAGERQRLERDNAALQADIKALREVEPDEEAKEQAVRRPPPQPYPEQHMVFMASPPPGWGGNMLSVQWTNAVTRRGPRGSRVPWCFMEVTIGGRPARVLDRGGQAMPGTTWTVREGSRLRPAFLIPPGETVYLIRNRPEPQDWVARCYTGPPRMVEQADESGRRVTVPVLQLVGEKRGQLWRGSRIRVRRIRHLDGVM